MINFDLLLELKKEKNQTSNLTSLLNHVKKELQYVDSKKKVKTFTDHKKSVKCFVWSPKFRLVASAGDERHM